jgi:hypothetical protein
MTQLLIKYGNIALTTTTINHRETDRFFAASGVQLAQHDRDQFHFRRAAFDQQLKSRVGLTLVKAAALRINLNIDGAPITSTENTVSRATQCMRGL